MWDRHHVLKRVPVRPRGDIVVECVPGAERVPNLTVSQKFVVSCYGPSVNPTLDQSFGCFHHFGCWQQLWKQEHEMLAGFHLVTAARKVQKVALAGEDHLTDFISVLLCSNLC